MNPPRCNDLDCINFLLATPSVASAAEAARVQPVRQGRAQANHSGCAIGAFVRLEYHRFTSGVSWFQAKREVFR